MLAEVLLDELLRLCRVEVAGDHEREVVRRVVGPEELLHVVERGRRKVLVAPDDGPGVGVLGRVEVLEDQLERPPVRPVLEPLSPLVLHDVALVVEVLLRQEVHQRQEAVRLEPKDPLEVSRRHGDEIVRPIVVRRAVDAPFAEVRAHLLGDVQVLLRRALRAFEHEVLEQVGEAGASRLLVLRTDVEPLVHVDDRQLPVDVQDDLQAVRQRIFLERELRDRARPDPVADGAVFPAANVVAAVSVKAATREEVVRRIDLLRNSCRRTVGHRVVRGAPFEVSGPR